MISMRLSSVSRRELFVLAARAGLGAAAIAALPRAAFGALQAGATEKHASLIARSARPVDFGTPVDLLDSFITPNEAFFVRGHMTAPAVDPQAWRLSVEGEVVWLMNVGEPQVRLPLPSKVPLLTATVFGGLVRLNPKPA